MTMQRKCENLEREDGKVQHYPPDYFHFELVQILVCASCNITITMVTSGSLVSTHSSTHAPSGIAWQ